MADCDEILRLIDAAENELETAQDGLKEAERAVGRAVLSAAMAHAGVATCGAAGSPGNVAACMGTALPALAGAEEALRDTTNRLGDALRKRLEKRTARDELWDLYFHCVGLASWQDAARAELVAEAEDLSEEAVPDDTSDDEDESLDDAELAVAEAEHEAAEAEDAYERSRSVDDYASC
jgi:hypothetical protein